MVTVSDIKAGPAPVSASGGDGGPFGPDEIVITDKRGRLLKLRRVGPLLRVRLFKVMGPENSRNIPLLGHYQMAISVVQIDDERLSFPTKDIQIDSLLDRLGDDGIESIAQAWRDNKWIDTDEGNPDNIKN